MDRRRQQKILALLLCILFILVSFQTISFITEHALHDCIGHDCSVCAQLQDSRHLLQQFAAVLIAVAFLAVNLHILQSYFQRTAAHNAIQIPVLLKVRMNN